jgi:hypothetical protein
LRCAGNFVAGCGALHVDLVGQDQRRQFDELQLSGDRVEPVSGALELGIPKRLKTY